MTLGYSTIHSGRLHVFLMIASIILLMAPGCQNLHPGIFRMYADSSGYIYESWPSVYAGEPEEMDQDTPVLPETVLEIDTISPEQFEQFVNRYSSLTDTSTDLLLRNDSSFTLKNRNFSLTLPAYRICECQASQYLGFIKPLNLYVIETVDMANELAYMTLVDYRTGHGLGVPSNTDAGPSAFLISPKMRRVLSYESDYYHPWRSNVYVMDIERKYLSMRYRFHPFLKISLAGINISKLIWVKEHTVALAIMREPDYENGEQEPGAVVYLKIELPKSNTAMPGIEIHND